MAEESKAVENTQVAAPEGVENTSSNAPVDDSEARFNALQEELTSVKRDRDNYRSGLLAMKGKIETNELDLTDQIQLQSYINKTVEDSLLATKEARVEADLRNFNTELIRKNKEMALALANKNVIHSGASAGSGSQPKVEATSPDTYWDPETARYLKEVRGLTDEQIKQAALNARKMGA